MSYVQLNTFAELTADGNTAAFEADHDINLVDVFLKDGADDGGGTLKMQASPDGTNWYDVPNASWTSGDGHLGQFTVYGRHIRFNLASSTTPSDVVVQIKVRAKSGAVIKTVDLTADGSEWVVMPRRNAEVAFVATGDDGTGTLTFSLSPDARTTEYAIGTETGLTGSAGAAATIYTNDEKAVDFKVALASATNPDVRVYVMGAD